MFWKILLLRILRIIIMLWGNLPGILPLVVPTLTILASTILACTSCIIISVKIVLVVVPSIIVRIKIVSTSTVVITVVPKISSTRIIKLIIWATKSSTIGTSTISSTTILTGVAIWSLSTLLPITGPSTRKS